MNLSNPKVVHLNSKKPSKPTIIEKISAFIGLIEAAGSIGVPDKMKHKITPKQRDRIILILVLLIVYFIGMGIFSTFYFLTKLL